MISFVVQENDYIIFKLRAEDEFVVRLEFLDFKGDFAHGICDCHNRKKLGIFFSGRTKLDSTPYLISLVVRCRFVSCVFTFNPRTLVRRVGEVLKLFIPRALVIRVGEISVDPKRLSRTADLNYGVSTKE